MVLLAKIYGSISGTGPGTGSMSQSKLYAHHTARLSQRARPFSTAHILLENTAQFTGTQHRNAQVVRLFDLSVHWSPPSRSRFQCHLPIQLTNQLDATGFSVEHVDRRRLYKRF